jgi:protein gp37
MAENSKIEWTEATWNPVVGCSIISSGCTNCYAMKMAGRLEAMGSPIYRGHTTKTKAGYVWNGKVAASNWGQMIKPLSWKKPRRIFVNSMSDLFHEAMPVEVIDQVFAVMTLCPQHTFQVLTKRFSRMRDYCLADRRFEICAEIDGIFPDRTDRSRLARDKIHRQMAPGIMAPLENVWLGASVEDQHAADYRVPALLETPAAVRFLSCEPLLGPVSLRNWLTAPDDDHLWQDNGQLHWVIAGGESGPGHRRVDLDWMRSIRDQCAAAGTPFFGKQDNKVHPLPDDLMVRQFPEVP